MKKIPTFNDTVYEIDRNSFDLWIKRFKDELNNEPMFAVEYTLQKDVQSGNKGKLPRPCALSSEGGESELSFSPIPKMR